MDLGLISQFYAYYKPTPPKGHSHHHRHDRTKRSLISSSSSSPRLHASSAQHVTHISNSSSPSAHATSTNRRRHPRIPGSFEEMSAAAANVARAAEAVAASKRGGGNGTKGSRSRSTKRKAPSGTPSMGGGARLEDSVTTLGGGSVRSDVSYPAGTAADGLPWDSSNSSSRHNLTQPSPGDSPVSTRSRVASNPGIHLSNSTASLESQSSSTTSPISVQRPTYSEGQNEHTPTASERGRTLTRPPPTFGVQPPTPENPAILEDAMAYQHQRGATQHLPLRRSGSRSLSVARGGGTGGRSTAGVVLMSLVGLVGLGGLGSSSSVLLSRRSMDSRGVTVNGDPVGIAGRILWSGTDREEAESSPMPSSPHVLLDDILPPSSSTDAVFALEDSLPSPSLDASSRKDREHDPDDRPRRNPHGFPAGPPVTWERLIGRVSAWTCTVLYLTSRMPQIWKNVTSALFAWSTDEHLLTFLLRPALVHPQINRRPLPPPLRLCFLRKREWSRSPPSGPCLSLPTDLAPSFAYPTDPLRLLHPPQPPHGPPPPRIHQFHPRIPPVPPRLRRDPSLRHLHRHPVLHLRLRASPP